MEKYLGDALRNNLRPIIDSLTRPQQKAVSEIVRGLFTMGKPILRHLAQDGTRTRKKQAEKYSHHLGNVDLVPSVEALALRKAARGIRKHTVIAYDLSDIAKPFAEKMEKLSRVWDGSAGMTEMGFTLHGVGVNGLLLHLTVHDDAHGTTNGVRLELVKRLSETLDGQGLWVFDRGCDGKVFFQDLRQIPNVRFIARLRGNRHVVDVGTGVRQTVDALVPGAHVVHLLDAHGKTDTTAAYTLVVKRLKPHHEPLRLLTNLPPLRFSRAKVARLYLERWGIEDSFKRAKTKFGLERIRVASLRRITNLVACVQLALLLATLLFRTVQASTRDRVVEVVGAFRMFTQQASLDLTLEAFISFLRQALPPLVHRDPRPPGQLTLLSKRVLAQL